MLDIHNVCITHAKIYKTSPQKRGVKRGRHKQIRSSIAEPLSPATTVELAVKRNKKRNIMSLARDLNFHFLFFQECPRQSHLRSNLLFVADFSVHYIKSSLYKKKSGPKSDLNKLFLSFECTSAGTGIFRTQVDP